NAKASSHSGRRVVLGRRVVGLCGGRQHPATRTPEAAQEEEKTQVVESWCIAIWKSHGQVRTRCSAIQRQGRCAGRRPCCSGPWRPVRCCGRWCRNQSDADGTGPGQQPIIAKSSSKKQGHTPCFFCAETKPQPPGRSIPSQGVVIGRRNRRVAVTALGPTYE